MRPSIFVQSRLPKGGRKQRQDDEDKLGDQILPIPSVRDDQGISDVDISASALDTAGSILHVRNIV